MCSSITDLQQKETQFKQLKEILRPIKALKQPTDIQMSKITSELLPIQLTVSTLSHRKQNQIKRFNQCSSSSRLMISRKVELRPLSKFLKKWSMKSRFSQ